MRRFYFMVIRNRKEFVYKIYNIKNNKLERIGEFSSRDAHGRGTESDIFVYLIEKGEIPKKYMNSSVTPWSGPGYFQGEVTKLYEIIDIEYM